MDALVNSPSGIDATRWVGDSPVYVRSEPTDQSSITDVLSTGMIVRLIKRSESWVLIEYDFADPEDSKVGWIGTSMYEGLSTVQ